MPMVEVTQNSAEWLQMRIGACTASRMADVMNKLKNGGESAKRASYKADIVCERLTGRAAEHYLSAAMEWGIDNEPLAKAAYEVETGNTIEQAGLAMHPRIEWLMASPDGLIGTDGLIECKCPNTSTQIGYILAGVVPAEYVPQMLCQMACAERSYCDFISYDPRLPGPLQLFIRRLERDEEAIAAMELEAQKLLAEVEQVIASLKTTTLVDLGTLETKLQASLAAVKANAISKESADPAEG